MVDNFPLFYAFGVPMALLFLTYCALDKKHSLIVIFFGVLSVFMVLLGGVSYIDITSGKSVLFILDSLDDKKDIPYFALFEFVFVNSLAFTLILVVIPFGVCGVCAILSANEHENEGKCINVDSLNKIHEARVNYKNRMKN